MIGLLFFVVLLAGIYIWRRQNRKEIENRPIPPNPDQILETEVKYYRELPPADKPRFVQEVNDFLRATRIDPINTTITDTDKILVAASAVIPVFGFKEWHYSNLTDVLIYDDQFNENFQSTGDNRNLMGMVGSGYMNDKMLLSKTPLRDGFSNKTDKENTGIHEFVHLLDKTDGVADGLPEALLDKPFVIPWLHMIHQQIKEIQSDKSDINPYGSTNQAEFFAVASEYFFERPALLERKHPELYKMLEQIFKQDPGKKET